MMGWGLRSLGCPLSLHPGGMSWHAGGPRGQHFPRWLLKSCPALPGWHWQQAPFPNLTSPHPTSPHLGSSVSSHSVSWTASVCVHVHAAPGPPPVCGSSPPSDGKISVSTEHTSAALPGLCPDPFPSSNLGETRPVHLHHTLPQEAMRGLGRDVDSE